MEEKRILAQNNIYPSRRLDQHFLIDNRIAERQINYANISDSDVVLEIGSGIGILTEKMEKLAKKVYAIEVDERLCDILSERCENAHIICGDIMKLDLPHFDKVVANLPYSLSSAITFKLFDYDFKLGVLMYQLEFAQRMIAKPHSKEYSRLSVNTQFFADIGLLEVVPKTAFYPKPKVKSAIVGIIPKKPDLDVKDRQFFFKVVTAIFTHRRKKLRGALRNSLHLLKIENTENIEEAISSLPKDFLDKRGEELTPKELAEVSNILWNFLEEKFSGG